MNFSDLTSFGFNMVELERKPQTCQEIMAEPIEESQLTDDFVVNMVDRMETVELSTIDYNPQKFSTTDMYTNLVPATNQYELTTLSPMTAVPESFAVFVPSPSVDETSESSLFSPMGNASPSSPASSIGSESPGSVLSTFSSTTEESITLVVSPSEVFGDQEAPLKKKRGRKPKSEGGPISRQRKTRKVKVYEINQPFQDKEMERKRLNAVNAKRHRDLQKQAKQNLEQQLSDVITERDNLKKEVESLRSKESELTRQLEAFKNHIKNQHNSVVMLLQSTPGF